MRPFKFTDEWGVLPGETMEARKIRLDRREVERKSEDKERGKTRAKTTYFMRKNRIDRPICVCGAPKAEVHHTDYDFWYLVGFLCRRCHVSEHYGRLGQPYRVYDLREMVPA